MHSGFLCFSFWVKGPDEVEKGGKEMLLYNIYNIGRALQRGFRKFTPKYI